jgi:hypothetical protein
MREIKFRAWDINGEEMSAVFTISTLWEHDDSLLADFGEVEFMQFTGLADKNGKEIYEGDIVDADDMTGEVAFVDGAWKIYYAKPSDGSHTDPDVLFEFAKHVVVAGNVYENPIEGAEPLCRAGLAPHDYDINDQGDQVDLKCRNCGHTKTK